VLEEPGVKNKEHPAAVLRVAWNVHRLDAIRRIVDETIHALQGLDSRSVLGRELSELEQQADSPVGEALVACCNELREACGLPLSATQRVDLERPTQEPEWLSSYENALEKYRDVAGAALQAALNAATAPPSVEPPLEI
jgi:hypothetical protein